MVEFELNECREKEYIQNYEDILSKIYLNFSIYLNIPYHVCFRRFHRFIILISWVVYDIGVCRLGADRSEGWSSGQFSRISIEALINEYDLKGRKGISFVHLLQAITKSGCVLCIASFHLRAGLVFKEYSAAKSMEKRKLRSKASQDAPNLV